MSESRMTPQDRCGEGYEKQEPAGYPETGQDAADRPDPVRIKARHLKKLTEDYIEAHKDM